MPRRRSCANSRCCPEPDRKAVREAFDRRGEPRRRTGGPGTSPALRPAGPWRPNPRPLRQPLRRPLPDPDLRTTSRRRRCFSRGRCYPVGCSPRPWLPRPCPVSSPSSPRSCSSLEARSRLRGWRRPDPPYCAPAPGVQPGARLPAAGVRPPDWLPRPPGPSPLGAGIRSALDALPAQLTLPLHGLHLDPGPRFSGSGDTCCSWCGSASPDSPPGCSRSGSSTIIWKSTAGRASPGRSSWCCGPLGVRSRPWPLPALALAGPLPRPAERARRRPSERPLRPLPARRHGGDRHGPVRDGRLCLLPGPHPAYRPAAALTS